MQLRFEKYLFENCIRNGERKIVLAVSGGIDSMLMLHLFSNLKNLRISVAHCNFKLRSEESDKDEKLVKEWCSKNEITFHHHSFDTNLLAKSKRISIQMAARELRYQWFNKLLNDNNYDLIATAHHQNDVLETMLLNITKGTGIAGLHGISAVKKKIIRPMLFCTRKEIEEYSKLLNIVWREDKSNEKNDYSRNKIRNKVVPLLKEINPSLEKTFISNAKHFGDAELLVNDYVKEIIEKITTSENDTVLVSIDKLLKLKNYKSFIGVFLSGFQFNDTVISDLIKNIGTQPGKMFYSDSHELLLDRSNLILSRRNLEYRSCAIAYENEVLVHCDHFNLSFMKNEWNRDELNFDKSNKTAMIDFENLKFPLKIRPWEYGDVFKPLGTNGKKKVSDFLIDAKVNRKDKEKTMVLTSGDDIAWLIGFRIDDRFKINANTKQYLEIKVI